MSPSLDANAERALIARAQGGDNEAQAALVRAHLPFARRLARRYARAHIAHDDLVAQALLGLIEAIARFDRSRDVRLLTYAAFWMRARVAQLACPARPVEVALDEVDEEVVVVGAPADDVLATRRDAAALRARLRLLWPRLDRRQRRILVQRLMRDQPRPLSALAATLGVSRERVRQLEAALVKLLARRCRDLAS